MIDSQHKLVIALVCLSNITISFNTGAVAAAIPVISADLGLSALEVSRAVPYYMIPYGIGALLYAPLSRIISYRLILILAMAVYAIFSFITGTSHSLNQILWAQIGCGIAAASSTPLSLMVIGELFEKEVRGRLVGIYFGTSFMASIVGMMFMGHVGWHWLFYIPAMIGMVTLLGLVFMKSNLLNRTHKESVNYFKALSQSRIGTVFVYIFIMSFLYHALHKWYGVYLTEEYGLDKTKVSWFLIIAALCGLSGQQIGGYLSDKKGRMISCYVGIFILSIAVMLLLGHYSLWFVPIILGAISVGWTINHNSVSTVLTDFPDEDRPLIASLNSAVRFFSGGLGFALSKFFVEKSFGLTFFGIGVLMFLMSGMIKYIGNGQAKS